MTSHSRGLRAATAIPLALAVPALATCCKGGANTCRAQVHMDKAG
ncbi:hypothetical protein [Streptomyces sp. ISL-100]|nr:hypothetical protein [Streptomyces sp. ISL-100]